MTNVLSSTHRTHPRRLKCVDIKLTDVCNVNCVMCGQRVRKEGVATKNFVELARLETFLDEIPEGMRVYLWGGEPLIHPRFREVVSFFVKKKSRIAVNTNGFLIKNHIDFLVNSSLDALVISFDGLGALHDKIRRQEGLFQQAKEGLLLYIDRTRQLVPKRSVVVNFTVIPENYLAMEAFCAEVRSWDIKSITMNLPILVDGPLGERFSDKWVGLTGKRLISWRGYTHLYKDAFDYERFSDICGRLVNRYGHFIRWSNETMPLNPEKFETLLRTYGCSAATHGERHMGASSLTLFEADGGSVY